MRQSDLAFSLVVAVVLIVLVVLSHWLWRGGKATAAATKPSRAQPAPKPFAGFTRQPDWPSENEAATSGNVALPTYKIMASSMRLTCATEAKYLCHNSSDGQSVGTLILARLVAQRLTPCNYDIKGYATLSH
jgi:hypothetical protein